MHRANVPLVVSVLKKAPAGQPPQAPKRACKTRGRERLLHDLGAFGLKAERHHVASPRNIGFKQSRSAARAIAASIALPAGSDAADPRKLKDGGKGKFQRQIALGKLTGNATADARQGMRKI